MKNFFQNSESGHTLIEMLVVASIISILATVPVAYLREAKIRARESAALGGLNQIAAAYEMYRVVGGDREKMYPHFYSDGHTDVFIKFRNADEIWDKLVRQGLLPARYAGYRYNEPDLLAPGYILSIYPVNYGLPNMYSISPWESYAFALIPKPGSRQTRTLALIHGEHFGRYFTNARALKSVDKSSDLSNVKIFTFKDPEPPVIP